MSTETHPKIMSAVFTDTGEGTVLDAMTEDGVTLKFEMHPMALALLALTAQPALKAEKDRLDAHKDAPQPPAVPDTTEGLEG